MGLHLFDWSPLLQLLVLGVLVAAGPLAWWALRTRGQTAPRRREALLVLTLFLTFDLTLFGAFTRLTDSGLGCPDWPGCYGSASPVGARADIAAAEQALPGGPVTHGKAWVEMVHRYLASGVGFLILLLAIGAWRNRLRPPAGPAPPGPWWPTATLVWVLLQGLFGALTVTMKLFPAIVTLHLLGAFVLLGLLATQLAWQRGGLVALPGHLRAGLGATLALVALQSALGGWVSTNYAVLACTTFPDCNGSWWPAMDFARGFTIWRPLGLQPDGTPLPYPALTAIHYVHRLMAYAVLAALAVLAWRLRRVGALPRATAWLAGLALLQLATGLSNVVLGWPLLGAVAHTGGAAALVVVLAGALAASRSARPLAELSAHRTATRRAKAFP